MVKLSLFLHICWLHFFGLMAQPLFYMSNLDKSKEREEKQSHHSPVFPDPRVAGEGEPGGLAPAAAAAVALRPRLSHEAAAAADPVVVEEGIHAAPASAATTPPRGAVQPAIRRS